MCHMNKQVLRILETNNYTNKSTQAHIMSYLYNGKSSIRVCILLLLILLLHVLEPTDNDGLNVA